VTDKLHFVKVEPAAPDMDGWRDRPTVTFECRGDRNSKCHQYPDCDCEGWCEGHEHPSVAHDECWMQGWFDNDGHSYEGPESNDMDECGVPRDLAASGQIVAQYEYDGYLSWEFAA